MSKVYRNHNNFKVSGSDIAVVQSRSIFPDIDLWEAVTNEIRQIQGDYYWVTTVENAVSKGYDCTLIEGNTILNSTVIASRNQ
jgi:hypothetical protein